VWFSDDDSSDDGDGIEKLDEQSFRDLEDRVDGISTADPAPRSENAAAARRHNGPIRSEADFEAVVREALDGLPPEIEGKLDDVVVTVSDEGQAQHAYGMFIPGTRSNDGYRWWFFGTGRNAAPSQIVIYRDTLLRDYGRDPRALKQQIITTVRHEVGHALGFDEDEVRRLGL
jgi:predicted Zn-dependent protease with MMP-like domain